jgi:hypothetical protein
LNWAWRYIPAIPVLRRLRQEDLKFKDRLSYIGRLCLKKKKKSVVAREVHCVS